MANEDGARSLARFADSRTSRRRFLGCSCTAAAAVLTLSPAFLAVCSSDEVSGSGPSPTPQIQPTVPPQATLFTNVNVFTGTSIGDPYRNFKVIMKSGQIFKNTLG